MDSSEWNPSEQETEYRIIAWEVISRMTIARLLEDCVDALVEAYQIDEELYITDKEMVESEDNVHATE